MGSHLLDTANDDLAALSSAFCSDSHRMTTFPLRRQIAFLNRESPPRLVSFFHLSLASSGLRQRIGVRPEPTLKALGNGPQRDRKREPKTHAPL